MGAYRVTSSEPDQSASKKTCDAQQQQQECGALVRLGVTVAVCVIAGVVIFASGPIGAIVAGAVALLVGALWCMNEPSLAHAEQ